MYPDPFDLARFEQAQDNNVFEQALKELRAGCKTGHWMWFVFPQIKGLGHSPMDEMYSIKSKQEAMFYLARSPLGPRLVRCTQVVNQLVNRTINQIFHDPDDEKFFSCMTLFAEVSAPESPFHKALDIYFNGKRDTKTLEILARLEATSVERSIGSNYQ